MVEVCLHFLSGAGLHPLEIQVSALLAIQHATLHQFEAKLVVL